MIEVKRKSKQLLKQKKNSTYCSYLSPVPWVIFLVQVRSSTKMINCFGPLICYLLYHCNDIPVGNSHLLQNLMATWQNMLPLCSECGVTHDIKFLNMTFCSDSSFRYCSKDQRVEGPRRSRNRGQFWDHVSSTATSSHWLHVDVIGKTNKMSSLSMVSAIGLTVTNVIFGPGSKLRSNMRACEKLSKIVTSQNVIVYG